MGLQRFHGKVAHPLLWAGSQAALLNILINGIQNCPNYYEIFRAYTQFSNVAASRTVGDPWPIRSKILLFRSALQLGCIPADIRSR